MSEKYNHSRDEILKVLVADVKKGLKFAGETAIYSLASAIVVSTGLYDIPTMLRMSSEAKKEERINPQPKSLEGRIGTGTGITLGLALWAVQSEIYANLLIEHKINPLILAIPFVTTNIVSGVYEYIRYINTKLTEKKQKEKEERERNKSKKGKGKEQKYLPKFTNSIG